MNELLVNSLVPVVTPLLVGLLKRLFGKTPKGSLPVIAAAVVGPALQAVGAAVSDASINPALGVALGAAGVGARECYDQIGKKVGIVRRK